MSAAEKGAGALGRALRAEWGKGRRGGGRKVALVAPLPFCALGAMASGVLGGGGSGMTGFATYGWAWWYTLMLPVAVALVTASVANLDARLGMRSVLGLPLDPARTWWAKVACALALSAAASLVVVAADAVVWLLGGNAPGPVHALLAALALSVGMAWMVPAGLALTARAGTLAGIAVPALVELAAGIALYASPAWWLVPPAAAMRLPSALLGVEPSGVPMAPGDAMWSFGPEWFGGLAACALLFVALALAGARWFSGGEAR